MDFDSVVQIICARNGRRVLLDGCRTTYGDGGKQDGNEAMSFHARPSPSARLSSERPFLFIRPKSRVLCVDCLFYILNLLTFFVHCIRIQRNVLADLSADAVAIRVTVQIVLVPRIHIAAAVTGHSFQQLRDFLGNTIDLRDLAGK